MFLQKNKLNPHGTLDENICILPEWGKKIMLIHTNTTHKKEEESLISNVIDCRQESLVPKKNDGQFVIARARLLARSEWSLCFRKTNTVYRHFCPASCGAA